MSLVLWIALALGAEPLLEHSGRLLAADGTGVHGPTAITVELVDSDGDAYWTEQHTVPVSDGYYHLALGEVSSLTVGQVAAAVSVRVTAAGITTESPVRSVPRAAAADGIVILSGEPDCGAQTEGGLRWTGSSLQVCTASAWSDIGGSAGERTIGSVELRLQKSNNPTNDFYVELYAGTPGGTSASGGGTLLAVSEPVWGRSIHGDAWTEFTFESAPALTAGPHYLVLKGPTTADTTNYVRPLSDNSGSDLRADSWAWWGSTGAWTSTTAFMTQDLAFRIVTRDGRTAHAYETTTNEVFMAGDTYAGGGPRRIAISFDPTDWYYRDGSSQQAAAQSCRVLHDDLPDLPSGAYWIDPDLGTDTNARRLWCDMDHEGGGWTLVASIQNGTGVYLTTTGEVNAALLDDAAEPVGTAKVSDAFINGIGREFRHTAISHQTYNRWYPLSHDLALGSSTQLTSKDGCKATYGREYQAVAVTFNHSVLGLGSDNTGSGSVDGCGGGINTGGWWSWNANGSSNGSYNRVTAEYGNGWIYVR